MAKFDGRSENLIACDLAMEKRRNESEAKAPRPYMGMSGLGTSCTRKLWYDFRWASHPNWKAETLKKFDDGFRTEDLIVERLQAGGLDVQPLDPDGNQWEVVIEGTIIEGHMDGLITGLSYNKKQPHVLEVKCVGDDIFAKVEKLVEADPTTALYLWHQQYYGQAQCYMYATDLPHYMVVATAGGRRWLDFITPYDEDFLTEIVQRGQTVIATDNPRHMRKTSSNPSWWECRICSHHAVCHEDAPYRKSCRTCSHSAFDDGNLEWKCYKRQSMLSYEAQLAACEYYEPKGLEL